MSLIAQQSLSDDEDELNPQDTTEVEESADFQAEEYYPVDYSISSYGADYPVDGLVKRINADSIYIPRFQRSYVWNIYRASRFIESLLLGLPVPAIFLSKELDSNKLLVVDGQQRLRTLQYFYNGVFAPNDRAFRLLGVQPRFQGKTYGTLNEDDRLRLDDSVIHAIIVKQESPDENGIGRTAPSSAYHIFERLNTGGVLLQPQEIRSCIYHGALIDLLEQLNGDPNWRDLFGNVSSRMRDRELIMRFLALHFHSNSYTKPMKEFLNHFASEYRNLDSSKAAEFATIFREAVGVIREAIGTRAFKTTNATNAALFDAIMVGVSRRLSRGPVSDRAALKAAYDALLLNPEFKNAISAGTTDDANVSARLTQATIAFRDTV